MEFFVMLFFLFEMVEKVPAKTLPYLWNNLFQSDLFQCPCNFSWLLMNGCMSPPLLMGCGKPQSRETGWGRCSFPSAPDKALRTCNHSIISGGTVMSMCGAQPHLTANGICSDPVNHIWRSLILSFSSTTWNKVILWTELGSIELWTCPLFKLF